jgi:hypothetical protein
MYTGRNEMTASTMEMKNDLFTFAVGSTKDKVLSFRIEEGMYKLLEDLAKEFDTDTVSQMARKILRFHLLNAIYEEEWKAVHSKDFNKFIQEVAGAGKEIEVERFKMFLQEFSEYLELLKSIGSRINFSIEFFEKRTQELEGVVSKLENASILFDRGINKGKSKNSI